MLTSELQITYNENTGLLHSSVAWEYWWRETKFFNAIALSIAMGVKPNHDNVLNKQIFQDDRDLNSIQEKIYKMENLQDDKLSKFYDLEDDMNELYHALEASKEELDNLKNPPSPEQKCDKCGSVLNR